MKWMRALILALALLAMGSALAADDGFTGTVPLPGPVPEATLADTLASVRRALLRAAGETPEPALTLSKLVKTGADFDEDTVWTATVTGGSGNYQFKFYLLNKIDPNGGLTNDNVNLHGCRDVWSEDNTFTYRLVVPETYYLAVFVEDVEAKDDADNPLSLLLAYKYVVADDTRITTAQKAAELADECLAAVGADATDYEKALWLHDWITHNAYYSQGQQLYYSEDGVLIRGEGVCDSYCKAYRLLLKNVGIECDRILNQRGTHAWNRARLEGDWVQIDATWDDPGSSTDPESGRERHLYFGLTDELMQEDHAYDASEDKPCVTLAMHYYVRQGLADQWLGALKCDALDTLEDRGTVFVGISSGQVLAACENLKTGKAYIPFAAMKHVMGQDDPVDLVMLGTREWQVHYTLDLPRNEWPMLCAEASPAEEVPVLVLPGMIAALGEAAFEGDDNVEIVVLPEGMTAVGARAFADCANLRIVRMPDTLDAAAIAGDAFEGSDSVVIYGSAGSGAEAHANEQGIPFRSRAENP